MPKDPALPKPEVHTIVAPGSLVYLNVPGGHEMVPAHVLQVTIGVAGVDQYQLIYYVGNDRKTVWVDPWEFQAENPHTFKIGFK